jgi:RNA polymerase sigma factor (sigma-70 family)
MLPHLDAAYNLARWLTGNVQDAEDVVQIAYTRAFEYFDRFHGGNSAAWIMTVVRNQAYTFLSKRKQASNLVSFNEMMHSQHQDVDSVFSESPISNPETLVHAANEGTALHEALERLPPEFREALLLREVEGYSYKEIAVITNVPQGTVMSRLSRARRNLQEQLTKRLQRESSGGM